MAKNNPTEKQIKVEIQATSKHAPAWRLTEEYKVYRYKIEKINLNYKLQLLFKLYNSKLQKGVLKNFAKFTWKHLCQSLIFIWIIFCYF